MAQLALKVGENKCDSPCLSDSLCFDYGLEQVATFSTFYCFYPFFSLIFWWFLLMEAKVFETEEVN